MAYVDAHCHVDLYVDYREVVAEAERRAVYTVAVTNTPSVFRKMNEIAGGSKYVRAALGLHPELAVDRVHELPLFEALVHETRYVGEVGLDFRRAPASSRDIQRCVFERILRACASAGGRLLTIHSRGAEREVIDLLTQTSPGTAVLHWYSGSLTNLRYGVDAGCFFSVNQAMCESDGGRRIVRAIPRDRLLTESDGPFVTASDRPFAPRDVEALVTRIADLREETPESIRDAILTNFHGVLRRL